MQKHLIIAALAVLFSSGIATAQEKGQQAGVDAARSAVSGPTTASPIAFRPPTTAVTASQLRYDTTRSMALPSGYSGAIVRMPDRAYFLPSFEAMSPLERRIVRWSIANAYRHPMTYAPDY